MHIQAFNLCASHLAPLELDRSRSHESCSSLSHGDRLIRIVGYRICLFSSLQSCEISCGVTPPELPENSPCVVLATQRDIFVFHPVDLSDFTWYIGCWTTRRMPRTTKTPNANTMPVGDRPALPLNLASISLAALTRSHRSTRGPLSLAMPEPICPCQGATCIR